MSELRKDPLVGRWVIISADRNQRGSDWEDCTVLPRNSGFCPFCIGNEKRTPPEIRAIRNPGTEKDSPGWKIRVVPNKFPALRIEGELIHRQDEFYETLNGIGAHEVVIETPDHSQQLVDLPLEHIRDLLGVYQERIFDLQRDQRFQYILVFKNSGYLAGASLEHSHSQIIATPITPKRLNEELEGFKSYRQQQAHCVICDLIRKEKEINQRIVYQGDAFIVLEPFAARFPFETWILPYQHWPHFEKMASNYLDEFAYILKNILQRIKKGLNHPPYNFIIHTAPHHQAEVTEIYHWRLEIIPKISKVAGFEWGSGFYINTVPPEEAARWLRDQQEPF
ncbi:galactose-1-phosphate uridylyltransferase [candidate division KSB1 bacterium]|nr:galactose-1-phosphate uridylyltransferase [candidate division KSB1 bacterium]